MAEEIGLTLQLDAQLKRGAADKIKRDLERGLSAIGFKSGGAAKGTPDQPGVANITKSIGTSLKSFSSGGVLGGLKNVLGIGMGAGLGAAGGMTVFEGMKSGIMKLYDLMRQSSPIFQRSLKMIQLGIMGMVRPFADTLGRIMYPISRFFMLWGRAIYAEYRAKYKEYVAGGMSPIQASLTAGTEAFVSGLWGLLTGKVGDIRLPTNFGDVLAGIITSIVKTGLEKPEFVIAICGIGALIVGAFALGLIVAAPFFTAAAVEIAGMIGLAGTGGAAAGLAGVAAIFAGIGTFVGGLFVSAITLGLKGLPFAIAAGVVFASTWLEDQINQMLGWRKTPEGGPAPAPGIPGGMPRAPMWPWEAGFKWPWEHAAGGIFTKPTVRINRRSRT